MNKRDLKKISVEFRTHSSDVLNSHFKDFLNKLKILIRFIQKTDLLAQYINSFPNTDFNVEESISYIINSHGNMPFSFGKSNNEIIVNTFKFLSSSFLNEDTFFDVAYSFSQTGHAQDMVKIFGQRVVLPFVNQLQLYLTNIGIDMGMDDSVQYNITVNNGGQVNLSQDSSTLNAVQNNNGVNLEHMQKMIDDILSVAKEHHVSDNDLQQITESLDFIKEELQKPSPKKTAVRMILDGLLSTSSILEAVPIIIAKVNDFAQYIAPLLN